MSDNRQMAAMLMNEAAETIVNKRPGVHGSAENSFEMIAQMWSVYLTHKIRVMTGIDVALPITGVDVAQMMSLLKKGRFVYGNPDNPDNFVDDLGYTALGGMLQLPDPDSPELADAIAKINPSVDDVPRPKKQRRKQPPSENITVDGDAFEDAIKSAEKVKVEKVDGVEGIDKYDPRMFHASDDGDTEEEAASAAELLNKIYGAKAGDE